MLNQFVAIAEDLVAPLEHIRSEYHFIYFIFDREAQSVGNILLSLILLTVDQLGSV